MKQIKNPYGGALNEIETGLWEHNVRVEEDVARPYSYPDDVFRSCLKIFMEGMMWKKWEHVGLDDDKAEKMGNEIRELVLRHTGIDTRKLYKTAP